jgi:hypothetical protein
MQTPSSPGPVPARWAGWGAVGAVLGGAALGSAGGPVAACELSAALAPSFGACVPAGAGAGALTGALVGLGTAPLCRHGSSRRRPAGHRPVGSTRAAAAALSGVLATAKVALEPGVAGQAGAGTSPAELLPPVVALVVSVAVVVLVLSPATARDFRRIGQPPLGGGDRRQGTDA